MEEERQVEQSTLGRRRRGVERRRALCGPDAELAVSDTHGRAARRRVLGVEPLEESKAETIRGLRSEHPGDETLIGRRESSW